MIRHWSRSPRVAFLFSAIALSVQACGSSGDNDTTTPTPGITISLSPTSASVAQGGSTTVTATVTATGGFSGTPTATITGAPAGVTITPTNIQTSGATTTITASLSVASTVPTGTYTLTGTGSGAGVSSVSATFTLTVTAAAASTFSLALTPASLSIAQSGSGSVVVNITRTSFANAITLAAEGLPSGVTAAFTTSPTTGPSATLTLTASATATTGTSNVTIRGTSAGATDKTTTLALMVTAPTTSGSYTLSATPATLTVSQGANGTSTINITRTGGFAGSVALAVTGAPTGVTATLNPTSTTGNTSTLTVAASATATTGAATLTITGTATGLANQTTTVALTVAAGGGGGSGNVTLDYSACPATSKPIWVAAQDGSGAWTRVTGTADTYKFNVTSGKGGYAATTQNGTSTATVVNLFTQAELTAGTINLCATSGTRSVTGTVAGLGQTDAGIISMGGASTTTTAASTNFTLNNMLSGSQDLVAYRSNLLAGPSAGDRAVIVRDLNPASGGSVGTIDFNGSSAITPASGTITVTGGAAGDSYFQTMLYLTGANCTAGSLYFLNGATNPVMPEFGIPAASQRATDFHEALLSASTSTTSTRTVIAVFHTLATQSIALGAALPTPTITSLSGSYKRLQAVLSIPSDYQTSATLTYTQGGKSGTVATSFGYLGSANATLAFPDFSGVAGFDPSWLPASSATVSTAISVAGSSIPITTATFSLCSEGLRFKLASFTGSN
jgi:hypothetical protein